VFGRYFGLFIRNLWVVIGVVQPLLYLVLFAPLLKSIAAVGIPAGRGVATCSFPVSLVQLGMFRGRGRRVQPDRGAAHGVIERPARHAGEPRGSLLAARCATSSRSRCSR
jgi:hypothetical protein